MRRCSFLVPAAVAAASLLAACEKDARPGVTANVDVETTPTMVTHKVETLISDSGITRYRIVSPLWLAYDEASVPRWRFPQGLVLEKFDDYLRKISTVECDSATYFKASQLWRLDGNVRIANTTGERFLTNQLFWDQKQHKIYSDSFIHIERPDRTLEGYGFTANERMTAYRINKVSGIFPASLLNPDSPATPQPTAADTARAGQTNTRRQS